jgi:hypothetical protein
MSNFPSKLVASRLGQNVAGTMAVTPHFVASLTGYYPEGFPAILEKLKKVAAFLCFPCSFPELLLAFLCFRKEGQKREKMLWREITKDKHSENSLCLFVEWNF